MTNRVSLRGLGGEAYRSPEETSLKAFLRLSERRASVRRRQIPGAGATAAAADGPALVNSLVEEDGTPTVMASHSSISLAAAIKWMKRRWRLVAFCFTLRWFLGRSAAL